MLKNNWRNVIVEINNESNARYDHVILQPKRVPELIRLVNDTIREGKLLLVGTYYGSRTEPKFFSLKHLTSCCFTVMAYAIFRRW